MPDAPKFDPQKCRQYAADYHPDRVDDGEPVGVADFDVIDFEPMVVLALFVDLLSGPPSPSPLAPGP